MFEREIGFAKGIVRRWFSLTEMKVDADIGPGNGVADRSSLESLLCSPLLGLQLMNNRFLFIPDSGCKCHRPIEKKLLNRQSHLITRLVLAISYSSYYKIATTKQKERQSRVKDEVRYKWIGRWKVGSDRYV